MIAIIIVNYRKSDLTVETCRSLARQDGRELLKVLIIDNAATAESQMILNAVKELPIMTEIISEHKNLGYFGGARRGLELIRIRGWKPRWVIVSNSDIEYPVPDFMKRLSELSDTGDIGVMAPRIESGLSGVDQNPYMLKRPGAWRMHFYKWVFRYYPTCFLYQMLGLMKALVKRRLRLKEGEETASRNPQDIYAAHGAYLIFSNEYFRRGGDFGHEPFLFGEEVSVAETARSKGLKVRYEPSLVVRHAEHGTMGWIPDRRLLGFQREASAFCADHYFPLEKRAIDKDAASDY